MGVVGLRDCVNVGKARASPCARAHEHTLHSCQHT